MRQVVHRLTDRMLVAALGQQTAGACVPENGQICRDCSVRYGQCSGGNWWNYYYKKRYNCTGSCVWSTYCYARKAGTC